MHQWDIITTMKIAKDLLTDVEAYCEASNPLGSLANISAAIMATVTDLNWVGFYIDDGSKLRLAPFQGKPACTEIAYTRGVCGAAYSQQRAMMVNDVDAFPDHIVCDASSRSEIVIPLFNDEQCVGVLDIDSPTKNRFKDEDLELFESLGVIISRHLTLNNKWFNSK
jgi:L-methionine (R)-S-oxide reductase